MLDKVKWVLDWVGRIQTIIWLASLAFGVAVTIVGYMSGASLPLLLLVFLAGCIVALVAYIAWELRRASQESTDDIALHERIGERLAERSRFPVFIMLLASAIVGGSLWIGYGWVSWNDPNVSTDGSVVEIHRFPTKQGKPRIHLTSNRTVRLFVPVSFVIVAHGQKAELVRIGLRWEEYNFLRGWQVLREIQLTDANQRKITAWDYRIDCPPYTETPMQDLVFTEAWPESDEPVNWPKRSRLVVWARVTGIGHWERVLGKLNIDWSFPQIGETGIEATDAWAYSGGRNWTSDGLTDRYIWNK